MNPDSGIAEQKEQIYECLDGLAAWSPIAQSHGSRVLESRSIQDVFFLYKLTMTPNSIRSVMGTREATSFNVYILSFAAVVLSFTQFILNVFIPRNASDQKGK